MEATTTYKTSIYVLADVLNREITLKRFPNQDGRWIAKFEDCDTKEKKSDPVITGSYGEGNTPMLAISNYVSEIAGKILVFNAMSDNRIEFVAPKNLTV